MSGRKYDDQQKNNEEGEQADSLVASTLLYSIQVVVGVLTDSDHHILLLLRGWRSIAHGLLWLLVWAHACHLPTWLVLGLIHFCGVGVLLVVLLCVWWGLVLELGLRRLT